MSDYIYLFLIKTDIDLLTVLLLMHDSRAEIVVRKETCKIAPFYYSTLVTVIKVPIRTSLKGSGLKQVVIAMSQ